MEKVLERPTKPFIVKGDFVITIIYNSNTDRHSLSAWVKEPSGKKRELKWSLFIETDQFIWFNDLCKDWEKWKSSQYNGRESCNQRFYSGELKFSKNPYQ
jgi:hypothetical protein